MKDSGQTGKKMAWVSKYTPMENGTMAFGRKENGMEKEDAFFLMVMYIWESTRAL